jgi:hypothetical protein
MVPQVMTTRLKLVGVQGVVRLDGNVSEELGHIYGRLFGSLTKIPDIRRPYRTVGYWHFVQDQLRLYFAGVEVDSFQRFRWDTKTGLAAWDLGDTTWAIWGEANGEEGSITSSGVCWDWMLNSAYRYDVRFIGDFEVYYWKTLGREPQSAFHEVWIPVVEKPARR